MLAASAEYTTNVPRGPVGAAALDECPPAVEVPAGGPDGVLLPDVPLDWPDVLHAATSTATATAPRDRRHFDLTIEFLLPRTAVGGPA
jgi:hypothetical protein